MGRPLDAVGAGVVVHGRPAQEPDERYAGFRRQLGGERRWRRYGRPGGETCAQATIA
jgi:hypothetical protein